MEILLLRFTMTRCCLRRQFRAPEWDGSDRSIHPLLLSLANFNFFNPSLLLWKGTFLHASGVMLSTLLCSGRSSCILHRSCVVHWQNLHLKKMYITWWRCEVLIELLLYSGKSFWTVSCCLSCWGIMLRAACHELAPDIPACPPGNYFFSFFCFLCIK